MVLKSEGPSRDARSPGVQVQADMYNSDREPSVTLGSQERVKNKLKKL